MDRIVNVKTKFMILSTHKFQNHVIGDNRQTGWDDKEEKTNFLRYNMKGGAVTFPRLPSLLIDPRNCPYPRIKKGDHQNLKLVFQGGSETGSARSRYQKCT